LGMMKNLSGNINFLAFQSARGFAHKVFFQKQQK
jgi:hypothetical protein